MKRKLVGWHDGRTGQQYHLECAPSIPKEDRYRIEFGDPDWGYGSVPVCQKCGHEICTVKDEKAEV